MQDVQENGYWSDDEEAKDKIAPVSGNQTTWKQGDKCRPNLDPSFRAKSEPVSEALCSYSSLLAEKSEKKLPSSGRVKARRRSLSIPSMGKHGSLINDPILSGASQG